MRNLPRTTLTQKVPYESELLLACIDNIIKAWLPLLRLTHLHKNKLISLVRLILKIIL